jgi:MOSC domain-containing protein YiiM
MSGLVLSVNVSEVRTVEYRGAAVTTGIFKTPVKGRIPISGVNLRGDDQADRQNHGGKTRAAYAYAQEDYAWWEQALSRVLPPGKFGENLTLRGIDVTRALVGERWRVGTAELQVTSPRVPCYKLAMTMEDPTFVKRFAQALRPGAYLSILNEGHVAAGDPVEVLWRPSHKLTLEEMARIYLFQPSRAGEMLVPELPDDWRAWALQHSAS